MCVESYWNKPDANEVAMYFVWNAHFKHMLESCTEGHYLITLVVLIEALRRLKDETPCKRYPITTRLIS